MKFSELELHPSLIEAVEKLKFEECTPVQAATIPHILEGRDIAGLAQTGTGKTAAFLLPLMERILRAGRSDQELTPEQAETFGKRAFTDWKPNQFVLVLVPTRELADQVYENCMALKGNSPLRAVAIYGGVSYDKQKQGLRDGVEFVIATPGRLIDLYKEHLVDLKQVRAIVFDEADRMFDMGFKDDMKYILQRVPKERQFLVFSATLNLDVLNTAYQFGANPVEINISRDQAKAENVEDQIFHVGQVEKAMYLASLLKMHKPRQAIVFSNFKMNVPRITQFLNDNKMPAVGISSLLTQAQRNRVMEQFKAENDRNILVATDVAARGLDIKGVDMVINFDLPDDPENYVHRIGRTGRAGAKGMAFSLVSDRDVDALARVEEYLKHKVAAGWIEDADLVKDITPMPSDRHERRGPPSHARDGEARGPGGGRGGRDRGRGREERPGRGEYRGGRRPARDQQRHVARDAGGPEGQVLEAGTGGGSISAAPREGRQHRDRSLGRHRGPEGQREGRQVGVGGRRGERPERHERGLRRDQRGRPEKRGGSPIQPQSGRQQLKKGTKAKQASQQTAGFGQKVSKFFKKLFGGGGQ